MSNKDFIVFLDIDNVACTERAYHAYGHALDKNVMRVWDPVVIQFLNRLTEEFKQLKFVISSTWGVKHDVPTILMSHGFRGNFHEDDKVIRHFGHNPRGRLVRDWLLDHPEILDRYLVLDDEESGDGIRGTPTEEHTVFCDVINGMLLHNYQYARQIIRKFT